MIAVSALSLFSSLNQASESCEIEADWILTASPLK